jgi:hypothetical protein
MSEVITPSERRDLADLHAAFRAVTTAKSLVTAPQARSQLETALASLRVVIGRLSEPGHVTCPVCGQVAWCDNPVVHCRQVGIDITWSRDTATYTAHHDGRSTTGHDSPGCAQLCALEYRRRHGIESRTDSCPAVRYLHR